MSTCVSRLDNQVNVFIALFHILQFTCYHCMLSMWWVLLLFVQQRCEEEYERFQRDKMVQAKNEFKALLKETEKIDYM